MQDKGRDQNRTQDRAQDNIQNKTQDKDKAQGETQDRTQNRFQYRSSNIGETSRNTMQPSVSAQQHVEVTYKKSIIYLNKY